MKAGLMDCTFNLRSYLSGDYLVSLIQDGQQFPASSIAELADGLIARLGRLDAGRIALATQRPDVILAALSACQAVRKQILLLRESYPIGNPVWMAWGVDCLLDDDLRETTLRGGRPAPLQAGVLLTTSGTTGNPKLALHDFDRLLGRVRHPRAEARVARWLLTYHPASFAGMQVLLTTLTSRSHLISATSPSMALLAETALRHRPTHVSGTPTFWRSFLLAVGSISAQLPLQQITLGGEAVDQHTLDQIRLTFPAARVTHIYASTEAGALFAVKDGRAGFPEQWLHDGIDGVQLRIRDGVLEVLSPRAMRSYLASSQQRIQADNGWIVTGDLVEVCADRVLFRGRLDGVINVGGGKVMPEQVESALLTLPWVREALVYGVRNPLTGALVAADIVLADAKPEDVARREITQHLSASLESHKVPRIINFVTAIPTSAAGKKNRTP
jgi:acyl-coenzyme A synthetase/AMP-(fatty) acid ligase